MCVAGKIFVNYRRDDAKAEAARLHDRLAQSFGAANVFMDVDNLLPGERFDLRLKEALAGTDVFLAVIGARWLDLLQARAASGERDYVREEIAAALAAKIVVIPVLMDRAPLPKAASLPEDICELALYHKHDVVYESFGRDVLALIAAIEAHCQARDKQAAEAARLTRAKEQAEIEAARRARQKAKEEAEAHRRAREKERKAGAVALPWKPAAAFVAVATVVILLIVQPWQRGPAPVLPAPGVGSADRTSAPEPSCEDALSNPLPRMKAMFRKPVDGKVISEFGPQKDGTVNEGITISVPKGTPIKAAENGVIAYVGSELPGFGNLILIRHADEYVTAYAHADSVLVKKCDVVKRGQTVATAGTTGDASQPQLHFEIRKNSKPVDPALLLGL